MRSGYDGDREETGSRCSVLASALAEPMAWLVVEVEVEVVVVVVVVVVVDVAASLVGRSQTHRQSRRPNERTT